ncbi:hypothetical protein ESCOMA231M_19840 [Escherichia coli]|nr:transposase IS3 family [Escherichia coli]CAD5752263.1 transposase IS3 family [Escherichia coli]
MFTGEQKIRPIELYFQYGKMQAPVVRELGYPAKRNLRRWIRSWEAGGGVKESIRHKSRYSDEQKQVAVEHYLNYGCCLTFTPVQQNKSSLDGAHSYALPVVRLKNASI